MTEHDETGTPGFEPIPDTLPPEPGSDGGDCDHGLPGDAETLPDGDADRDDLPSEVNDESDDDVVSQQAEMDDEPDDEDSEPGEEQSHG